MRTFFIYLLCLVSLLFARCKDETDPPKWAYFGQQIPQDSAEIFAPNFISLDDRWEGNANFSPDGRSFYFNVFTDSLKTKDIYVSKVEDEAWTVPSVFEEVGPYDNWEPFISYSGREFYFVSTQPPGSEEWNGRLMKMTKNRNDKWSEPKMVDVGFDTENGYWFPNHSEKNPRYLYFGGNIADLGSVGKGDLYMYDQQKMIAFHVEELSSEEEDWDPFVSPDGSFIMWASDRPGGYGGTDLYVSKRTELGWGNAILLGPEVNSSDYEVAPRISNDGSVLFFDRPIDGSQDIFWITSDYVKRMLD